VHPITRPLSTFVGVIPLTFTIACARGRPTDEFGPARRLPLGNSHVSSAPRVGYVFSCRASFNGRAAHGGPWIVGNTWDPSAKPVVSGDVKWPNARISMTVEGKRRVIRANNLPVTHPTGVFPIPASDSAYRYDRNPNAIREQNVVLTLPANPKAAAAPSCLPMGMIGFALSGVAIYNALDAAGMDAVANEIQDRCNGHPQMIGQYHYHNMSVCLTDPDGARGRHSDLLGFALDGYGIYGQHGERGKLLSNADLDACHGHEHVITWNGVRQKMYHYHATAEYPYTLGCFRGGANGQLRN
jgi:hypothetical protein